MSETIKLKPCPFCGGEAQVIFNFGWYYIRCIGCYILQTDYDTEEEAIEAWNQRVGE